MQASPPIAFLLFVFLSPVSPILHTDPFLAYSPIQGRKEGWLQSAGNVAKFCPPKGPLEKGLRQKSRA